MLHRRRATHAWNALSTVTKRELIQMLEDSDAPDDTPVVFQYNYGDHCRTQAVGGIQNAEESVLVETAYSHSGFAVPKEDPTLDEDPDEPGEDEQMYLVLR
jgi:hypothetical protein